LASLCDSASGLSSARSVNGGSAWPACAQTRGRGGCRDVCDASALAARPDDGFHIAGQVLSGIGFLGAGVILRNGLNISGLNTAATLWYSAAIGTLSGYGMYGSAISGAIAVIAANVGLRPIGKP